MVKAKKKTEPDERGDIHIDLGDEIKARVAIAKERTKVAVAIAQATEAAMETLQLVARGLQSSELTVSLGGDIKCNSLSIGSGSVVGTGCCTVSRSQK